MRHKAASAAAIVWMILACLAHAQFAEQSETGHRTLPGGKEINYRIRLLPLASFPALPLAILQQLSTRHCLIPQTYEARSPENVIHGSFRAPGSDDWAVLCSQNGTTTLYVFFGVQSGPPASLRSQPDTEWLGTESVGTPYGSAWGIALRPANAIPSARQSGPFDHDGIEDAHLEKSSQVHYFRDDKWFVIGGGD
jgi:hypothetical protein